MEARIIQPPPSSLRTKLAAAGGLSVQELAAKIETEMAASESPLEKGLRQIVHKLVELGRDPSDNERQAFTAAVSTLASAAGIMGRVPLGRACTSLLNLLEAMAGKPWDLPPVSVHIATVQLFAAEPDLEAAEVEELMEGLRDVHQAYAAEKSINH